MEKTQDTGRMLVKGQKSFDHEKGSEKKARISLLISDRIDFKTDYNKRQIRTLYNHKGKKSNNITIINIYVPKMETPKHIKQLTTS